MLAVREREAVDAVGGFLTDSWKTEEAVVSVGGGCGGGGSVEGIRSADRIHPAPP